MVDSHRMPVTGLAWGPHNRMRTNSNVFENEVLNLICQEWNLESHSGLRIDAHGTQVLTGNVQGSCARGH